MNHIYRRIWSPARHCWVVASELASSRTRKGSRSGCQTSPLLVVVVALAAPYAYAESDPLCPEGTSVAVACEANEVESGRPIHWSGALRPMSAGVGVLAAGPWSTTYGDGANAPGRYSGAFGAGSNVDGDYGAAFGYVAKVAGTYSAAFGYQSHAGGNNSAAFGSKAKTSGMLSAAFGADASALGGHASAFGAKARADGIGTVAVGHNAVAYTQNSIAVGSGSYTSSGGGVSKIAIGANSYAGTSGWTGAIALGGESRASYDSVAVGYEARTYAANSVALGRGSQALENNTVSVGTASNTRRVVNVYQGTLASGSTDAVNGGQLYSTNQDVIAVRTTANSAKASADSALSKVNTLGGLLSQISASGNVRLGGGNSGTVLDVRNSANTNRKITGVADATLSTTSTEAVSGKQLNATNSNVTAARSVADSAKTNADSALSKANTLTGLLSQASASGNVRVGASNSGTVLDIRNSANASRKITGVSDATLSTTSTEAVSGKQLNATNVNVTAARSVADTAKTNAESALTKANTLSGLLSQTSASGNVRLGATNSGTVLDVRNSGNASRKITGVADAALSTTSTDAVTGRQLNATNSNVSTALSDATAAKAAANSALTQVGTLNGLLGQASASGNVRVGEKNSGTVLDVRNSANGNRKLTGVADGVVSTSSYEAVNGRQLNATNDKVATVEGIAKSAGTEAGVAKTDAAKALAETAVLGGLVAQVSASGSVRLGEKNSGTTLDVRNSASANRKISGVADGALSGSSTEAVSGRQLYGTNSRVSALESANQYVSVGVDSFSQRAEAGLLGVAIGDSAKTGTEGGTALGALSLADGINSVAIGRGSTVSKDSLNGFAMGAGAQVEAADSLAIGAGAKVRVGASGALAIGSGAEATESDTASFGTKDSGRRLVNVARGTADHNVTTVSQLKDSLATLGGGAGMDANGNIIAPAYTLQGGTQNTVEDALMALDGAVITASRRADKVEGQLSSIFKESPSARADGMNQIALNGVNGMVLTNLADGRVAPGSRDAVTGSQLYAAEQKISQNRSDLDAMRKEREMGQQAMRGLDAGVIDYGGARLTGVAEAKLSADSSDVVRGSQLFSTNTRLDVVERKAEYFDFGSSVPDLEWRAPRAGRAGVAIGEGAVASLLKDGAVAVGFYATAHGENSVALGRAAWVQPGADHGFALGTRSIVEERGGIALGAGSLVKKGALNSVAVGNNSVAHESQTVSFGGGLLQRRLVNIANGTANHNAATVGQLRGALSALGGEVDSNGNIVGPRFNVQGHTQSTLNGALEALDGAVVTNSSRVDKVETQLRSVFQDVPSVRADGVNQLTLAGAHGMVISNVANGLIAAGSRDAVNGGQLHSMQQQLNGRMDGLEERVDGTPAPRALASSSVPEPQAEETPVVPEGKDSQQVASVGEGDKPTPQPKANKDDSPKPQVDTAELEKMLARANEYTDGAISNFERRLDKMDKRFNRMAAMSSAQSAMAMNTAGLATYNRLGAGVGYSEGESAMAVGYQRVLNEKGSATFSLNGAFTNSGERSMGVGVGIGW
ncbi:autotransporter [Stenotrophomonas maltophilia]|uniref:ESPR-type extended signal peptide-containing protein n=1 Tax=Stenotrophomonas maltophilia TaxID=40324 RepID=UPI0010949185|nr:ESPR-type extended signal peptide-containing protein [Stenotrophomonas maltophilia]TGW19165.1 autotransporter [Stenotrophomonas maltophilia]